MTSSCYRSGITEIYFPNMVARDSLLNILTRIFSLQLYKDHFPIIKGTLNVHTTGHFLLRALLYIFPSLSLPWSDLHAGGVLSGLTLAVYCCSSAQVSRFGAVYGNDNSHPSMHLRSHLLPRPSASSPLDYGAHPMVNTNQTPNLEGLHREIHDMAEQMRIMNENNARLIQHLTTSPLPQAAPHVLEVQRPRCSNRSGGEESHSHHSIGTSAPVIMEALTKQTELPFTKMVMKIRVSSKFKLPTQIRIYERKIDPMELLDSYKNLMLLQGYSDEEQIADLIKKGYLRKYVVDHSLLNSPERRYGNNMPIAGDIQVIHGKFGSGECSSSSIKRHAKSASGQAEEEVYNLSSAAIDTHPPITFNNDNLRGLHLPRDDALVVLAVIANFNLQRILVDNGSLTDILFHLGVR
ncbi:hypothetical protein Acr_26g0004180 [Actinidia rufa]|uniref:Uncharacterized protein n=1 Tax=Actinidia rufa TaxID=165716 RepID=A0A7J0H2A0_9ERIC|nr:hypothetical protein Acr_26g0004180 [Actinidia rufa]